MTQAKTPTADAIESFWAAYDDDKRPLAPQINMLTTFASAATADECPYVQEIIDELNDMPHLQHYAKQVECALNS